VLALIIMCVCLIGVVICCLAMLICSIYDETKSSLWQKIWKGTGVAACIFIGLIFGYFLYWLISLTILLHIPLL